MRNEDLAELLAKIDDIRRVTPLTSDVLDSVAKIIKEELEKTRQTGPAIGQKYWFAKISRADAFEYNADGFDLNVFKFWGGYPEERFAEAELRAKELIQAVNKRRRELNGGKEFEEYKFCIVFTNNSEVGIWVPSRSLYDRGLAYPFGLFKDSEDCETCMREFEDDLKWFFKEYLPLMEELDDYDWADAPGWQE